jgi:hypothetical protein
MSYFRGSYIENRAMGSFTEKEFGKHFEFRLSDGTALLQGTYGLDHGFQHEIAMCDGSVRFANVKKTVAYVVVDEDDFSNPVVEKWQIKDHIIWER